MTTPLASVQVPELLNAACRNYPNPDLFFPVNSWGRPKADEGIVGLGARRVCAFCVEREACLLWALENDERFGIWGGTDPAERERINRRRRLVRECR